MIEKGGYIPERLGPSLPNLSHIGFDELNQKFNGAIYSDQNLQKTTI